MAYLLNLTKSMRRISYSFCKGAASTASPPPIAYSEEVLHAKAKDNPLVALESTIITHGMPYPHNLKTALEVENIIRNQGATPATVAILKGQLTVGLSEDQLTYLAQAKGAVKASRRDLAPVLAAKLDGATTVAGTIIAAELAGIPVFVTGGIGGVHREGEHTMDISADLTELGRSSTMVVCSGVKSILDIGRTLEYLETQGVCVCAYGDTDEFPAFYTRRSGLRAPHRTASPRDAALLVHASQALRLTSGIVIAVPIPEENAMDDSLIENVIQEALKDAHKNGIKGKEVTPFILAAVARATQGASLDANIALIKNNAKVGADIAVELKKLKDINYLESSRNVGPSSSATLSPGSRRGLHTSCYSRFKVQTGGRSDFPLFGSERKSEGDVLIIGGANVDRTYRLQEDQVQENAWAMYCVWVYNKDGVHQLPKDETIKAQWITAAKLDTKLKTGQSIKTYTYVCSEHFQDNDFYYTRPLFAGDKGNKILKKGSVPSIFPWTLPQTREADVAEVEATTSFSIDDSEDHDVRFDPSLVVNDYSKNSYPIRFVEEIPFIEVEPNDITEDPLELSNAEKQSDTSTSDSFCLQLDHIDSDSVAMDIEVSGLEPIIGSCASPVREIKSYNDISVQTINDSPAFSVHTYKNDNKAIHFYTGLQSYKKMLFVFTSLGNDVHHLKYFYGSPPSSLDPLEQFFLTLIVLGRHKTFEELSMMYLISIKDVSNLLITWIRFMSLVWRKIDLWVGKETVKSYIPFDFNDKFPMTRVIIDATECPIKKPGLPRAQQITFSSYKNKNTVKFLLGITPSGLITYVSPCYGGSASDRQIIEGSEILNRFDPNDEIMVDKGFNVQDIFISYGVKVNMPAFFKKGNQIGPEMLKKNRKVASKRIHVERAIGLLKTYRILIEPMNNTEIILSSDIVFICAMLTNFRTNIISKNA